MTLTVDTIFQNVSSEQSEIIKSRLYFLSSLRETVDELDKKPGVVNLIEKTLAYDILGGQSCNHKWIPNWRMNFPYSFYVQKNSSLKPLVNYQYCLLHK